MIKTIYILKSKLLKSVQVLTVLNLFKNLFTFIYTPLDNKKKIQSINKLCYIQLFKVETLSDFSMLKSSTY